MVAPRSSGDHPSPHTFFDELFCYFFGCFLATFFPAYEYFILDSFLLFFFILHSSCFHPMFSHIYIYLVFFCLDVLLLALCDGGPTSYYCCLLSSANEFARTALTILPRNNNFLRKQLVDYASYDSYNMSFCLCVIFELTHTAVTTGIMARPHHPWNIVRDIVATLTNQALQTVNFDQSYPRTRTFLPSTVLITYLGRGLCAQAMRGKIMEKRPFIRNQHIHT